MFNFFLSSGNTIQLIQKKITIFSIEIMFFIFIFNNDNFIFLMNKISKNFRGILGLVFQQGYVLVEKKFVKDNLIVLIVYDYVHQVFMEFCVM